MVAMIDNRSFAPTVFDADGDDVEIVPATVPLLCCTLRPPRTRTLLRAHTPTMPLDCACRHELSRRPFLTVRACVPLPAAGWRVQQCSRLTAHEVTGAAGLFGCFVLGSDANTNRGS
jgi:hypothetical protein